MAEALGISQVQVSQVLGGKKDFTLEQAAQIGEFLALSDMEREYFLWLVILSRAGSVKLRKIAEARLKTLREKSNQLNERVEPDKKLSDAELATFYSHYLYSAIRLFTSIGPGKNFDEIMDRFRLGRTRAIQILEFLVSAGLCQQAGDLYTIGALRTGVGRDSPHLIRHHTNWRLLGLQMSDQLRPEEVMMTTTVSLSRKDFRQIQERLMAEIEEISKRVRDSDAEVIACWNMDWYELKV